MSEMTLEPLPLKPAITIDRLSVEPRSFTIADLLAIVAGISLSLALAPEDVRRLFDPAVWDSDRLPQAQSILLMTYLLGSWVVVCLCSAMVPAVIWRCVRYRRMPCAGEWLVILLLLVSPLVQVDRLFYVPLDWFYRQLDPKHPIAGWLAASSARQPVAGLMVAGGLMCLAGVALLQTTRKMHPLLKSGWIVFLLVLYLALPARYQEWEIHSSHYVPLWNAESWREFEFLRVAVLNHAPTWLPVTVAVGFVLQTFFRRSVRSWRWTEWAGPVMLLGTAALSALLLRHQDIPRPDWKWMLATLAFGIALSWPIGWCWRRWWSDLDAELQRGGLT